MTFFLFDRVANWRILFKQQLVCWKKPVFKQSLFLVNVEDLRDMVCNMMTLMHTVTIVRLFIYHIHCTQTLIFIIMRFIMVSVILWRSVLLVEENGGPGENHRPVTCH